MIKVEAFTWKIPSRCVMASGTGSMELDIRKGPLPLWPLLHWSNHLIKDLFECCVYVIFVSFWFNVLHIVMIDWDQPQPSRYHVFLFLFCCSDSCTDYVYKCSRYRVEFGKNFSGNRFFSSCDVHPQVFPLQYCAGWQMASYWGSSPHNQKYILFL